MRGVVFDFVGYQQSGFLAAAQYGGYPVVEVGNAVSGIDDKEYDVGLFDGDGHLFVDFFFKDVVGVDHPAAGIDNRKFLTYPVDLAILAVARGTGLVVDDGLPALGEPVEEGRFAHVGAAYDSY